MTDDSASERQHRLTVNVSGGNNPRIDVRGPDSTFADGHHATFTLRQGLYYVKASESGYYDAEEKVMLAADYTSSLTLQKEA